MYNHKDVLQYVKIEAKFVTVLYVQALLEHSNNTF